MGFVVPVGRFLGGLSCVTLSLLFGCAPSGHPHHPEPVVYAAAPPPPPLPEVESGPPNTEMVWVPGYWHWAGVRYVWVPGHWETPRPDHVWQPPRYSFTGERWEYRPGRWERSKQ